MLHVHGDGVGGAQGVQAHRPAGPVEAIHSSAFQERDLKYKTQRNPTAIRHVRATVVVEELLPHAPVRVDEVDALVLHERREAFVEPQVVPPL